MAVSYNTVTVGNTPTLIVSPLSARRGFLIQNNGPRTIYLGLDANVTADNGIPIVCGGNYSNTGDYDCYRGSYYAVTDQETSECRYQEWTP